MDFLFEKDLIEMVFLPRRMYAVLESAALAICIVVRLLRNCCGYMLERLFPVV